MTETTNIEIARKFLEILPDLTIEEISDLGIAIHPQTSTEKSFTIVFIGAVEYVR